MLLIDADLRHPGMANYLDLGDAPGLTAVLIKAVRLEDAVQDGLMPDLTVLPSGGLHPNPSELLQSSANG